jgi:hypothetical protein
VNAQIYQLGAAATRHLGGPAADHNGGYVRASTMDRCHTK